MWLFYNFYFRIISVLSKINLSLNIYLLIIHALVFPTENNKNLNTLKRRIFSPKNIKQAKLKSTQHTTSYIWYLKNSIHKYNRFKPYVKRKSTWMNISPKSTPYKNHCMHTMNVVKMMGKGRLSALFTASTWYREAKGAAKNIRVTQQQMKPTYLISLAMSVSYWQ